MALSPSIARTVVVYVYSSLFVFVRVSVCCVVARPNRTRSVAELLQLGGREVIAHPESLAEIRCAF